MKLNIFFIVFLLSIGLYKTYAQTIKTKYVSNLTEFINAVDHNTEIILTVSELDVTVVNAPSDLQYNYEFDAPRDKNILFINHPNGGTMLIRNIINLTIKSNEITKIFTKNTYDDVLKFENCEKINLENLILVHDPEAIQACEGDVLHLVNTTNFYGNNLELNGSGRIGLIATNSKNIVLDNSQFYHNSEFAFSLSGCQDVIIKNSEIRYNTLYILALIQSMDLYNGKGIKTETIPTNLTLENLSIHHNDMQQYFDVDSNSKIALNNCRFYENNSSEDHLNDDILNTNFSNKMITLDKLKIYLKE